MAEESRRLLALLIDGLFLIGFLGFLLYINISSSRSIIFSLLLILIWLLYKPFMEYYYGATLGKMAMKIRVTDRNMRVIPFKDAVLRNCILVIAPLGSVPYILMSFNDPLLANTVTALDFASSGWSKFPQLRAVILIQLLVIIADGVFLLTRRQKDRLSLKDVLASTRVVSS